VRTRGINTRLAAIVDGLGIHSDDRVLEIGHGRRGHARLRAAGRRPADRGDRSPKMIETAARGTPPASRAGRPSSSSGSSNISISATGASIWSSPTASGCSTATPQRARAYVEPWLAPGGRVHAYDAPG
jgi:hypothetical protein